jgi:DNA invertase Pin-like site-specific DNA recombinase
MADIGYARVSKRLQNLDLQVDALERAGCSPIFADKMSGARDDRPEFAKALAATGSGDRLTVWRLDRAGRSLQHLLQIVEDLQQRGARFRSLNESIDTSGATGRLVFVVLAALAQFERELMIERVMAGLEAARARGRVGGPAPYGIGPDHTSIVEAEATLLLEAAQRILDGETVSHLVDDWNDRGSTTRKGGSWSVTSIRTHLLNPRVVPILGEDAHNQLKVLFGDPDRRRQGRPAHHLLSGILRCGNCQQPLYGGHVTGNRWVYRCRKARGSGGRFHGCGGITISLPKADTWALEAFVAAITSEGSKLPGHVAAQLEATQAGGPTPAELAREAEELNELEAVLATRFATPEHWARATELEARATTAEQRQRAAPALAALASLPRTEAKLRERWDAWTTPEKRVWLRRVVESVKVAPASPGSHHRGSDIGARLSPKWLL